MSSKFNNCQFGYSTLIEDCVSVIMKNTEFQFNKESGLILQNTSIQRQKQQADYKRLSLELPLVS